MATDVDQLAGQRLGLASRTRHVLVGGADGGQGQHGQDRGRAATARFGSQWRRACRNIQTTSPSIAGGHTQSSSIVRRGDPRIARPATPMTTAGTAVQRWGWSVKRADSTPINAQPSPKASSIHPVMEALGSPGRTADNEDAADDQPGANEPDDDGVRSRRWLRRRRVGRTGRRCRALSMTHGGLVLAVRCGTAVPAWSRTVSLAPVRWPGCAGCCRVEARD